MLPTSKLCTHRVLNKKPSRSLGEEHAKRCLVFAISGLRGRGEEGPECHNVVEVYLVWRKRSSRFFLYFGKQAAQDHHEPVDDFGINEIAAEKSRASMNLTVD